MFLSAGELCHVLMGRSAASKLRRKSQREASELREQTYNKFFQDTLAMEEEELAREDREEEEEVVFKRRRTVPDTPRASRANTPDPDEGEEDHRQLDKVLQLVKSVRDQIKALVLDNTNIRAACDDLRRQCHSQGVAFGDLSCLVNRTREDQEESGTYARNQSGHNPQIRQELLDAEGTSEHKTSGSRGGTERPSFMVSGSRVNMTPGKKTFVDRRRQKHTRRVRGIERTPTADQRCRHRTNRVGNSRQGA